jgi:hypothetical protein
MRLRDQGNPQSSNKTRDLIDDPQHPRVYGRPHGKHQQIVGWPDRGLLGASPAHEDRPQTEPAHLGRARPRRGGRRGRCAVGVVRTTNDAPVLGDLRPRAHYAAGDVSRPASRGANESHARHPGHRTEMAASGRHRVWAIGGALMNRPPHPCRHWARRHRQTSREEEKMRGGSLIAATGTPLAALTNWRRGTALCPSRCQLLPLPRRLAGLRRRTPRRRRRAASPSPPPGCR